MMSYLYSGVPELSSPYLTAVKKPCSTQRMYASKRPKGVTPRYAESSVIDDLAPKTRRLTGKQIRFVELLASGVEQKLAAEQAGLKNRSSQYRTLTNPLAIQYLSTIRAESRAIAAYDVSIAMAEALADHKFAVEKGNAMAAVKATELRAKLSGLLIDRVEIATVDLTGALTRAEARIPQHIDVPPQTPVSTPHAAPLA